MDLKRLFNPSTMAVIGVSTSNDQHPANVIFNKNHLRYKMMTFPVSPKGGRLNRERFYESVADIEVPIDLAVIIVRSEFVPQIMEQCIAQGVGGAIVLSGGFAEVGNKALQNQLTDIAMEASFPFIGPNCLGIYSPGKMDTFFLPTERIVRPNKGDIAFISQSGGILVDQLVKFAGQKIGISQAVSIGNKACIREIDMLKYLQEDNETKVIAFYIEGFDRREGRDFVSQIERSSKPVVILKAGKSLKGRDATSSHTASLAGDYHVFSEVMKQYRVLEPKSEYELTCFCEALSCYPKNEMSCRRGIAIVTVSGGHGVIAVDICEKEQIPIAPLSQQTLSTMREELSPSIKNIASLNNPIDLTASSRDSDFVTCIRHLARDQSVDCILTLLLPYSPNISADIGAKLSLVARSENIPLIAYVPNQEKYRIIIEGFQLNRVPVSPSVEGAVSMIKALKLCRPKKGGL